MKLFCKQLGGSHSYGLATAKSDIDYRGVFANTETRTLIGLDKHEHQQNQENGDDEVYTEFRNALRLLRSANTQMVELLFAEEWLMITPEWEEVRKCRGQLIDSEKLLSCLRGYMQGEKRLANGERTGKLGGKRKEAIDTYGFSPKNFVQLFRLAWAGQTYFEKGHFPVNVMKENRKFGDWLFEVKTNPREFTKEGLNALVDIAEAKLVHAYEHRKVTTTFDDELAHNLCLDIYGPMIYEKFEERQNEKFKGTLRQAVRGVRARLGFD